jgi:stage V sporulation protein R
VTDGRGLDPERGRKVLEYIARVWRRPVTIATVDNDGRSVELAVSPNALS